MTMITPVIEVQGLVHAYDGKPVLDGVNLTLQPGTITGLLGKNGSGKTTLLNCLLGFLKPQAGTSHILGDESRKLSCGVRQRLAFVSQTNDLFDWMTAEQILVYTSRFYARWNQPLVDRLLLEWEIPLHQVIREMSVGQVQKLAIVLAMAHEPEVLLMDEPVASLDPAAKRAFIRQLIELNSEQGNTVLFSTHITSDIERVAADVAILRNGRTFYQGGIDELKERVVRLYIRGDFDEQVLHHRDGVLGVENANGEASVTVANFSPQLVQALAAEFQAEVLPQSLNLEDIFVAVAGAAT